MRPGVKCLIIMFFALLYTCRYNKIILSLLTLVIIYNVKWKSDMNGTNCPNIIHKVSISVMF